MRNQYQPIALEGYPFIALFAFLTLLCGVLEWGFLTFFALLLTVFTIYFFRNPERQPPNDQKAVIAPADGKIIYIGNVPEERYSGGQEMTKISIFMNVFNVHVNWVPVSGRVVDMFYNRGRFFNAALDKASLENEQSGMLIETEQGYKILCVQIAGLVARRIVTYPKIGDHLALGTRYGLIRFGSRVDVYLPVGTEIKAALGEKAIAGETILGILP